MEKHLNCGLLLPLEELALRRVITLVWNQIDVLDKFVVSDCRCYCKDSNDSKSLLKKLVPLVENKVSELILIKYLIKDATSRVQLIGLEIKEWVEFHCDFFKHPHTHFEKECFVDYPRKLFDRSSLGNLYWTSLGTVHYKKTAEELIRSEMLDPYLLFNLACLYCLEDYIPLLFKKLPKFIRESLHVKTDLFETGQSLLNSFWFRIINDGRRERKFDNLTHFYKCVFEKSACTGNKAATEYFYQKLNEEKDVLLFETAQELARTQGVKVLNSVNQFSGRKYSGVFCYLLSQMSPQQRIKLLKEHYFHVLLSFLKWPWQDLFLDAVKLTWDFLPADDYCKILFHLSWNDNNLGNLNEDLFRKLLSHSPNNFKIYFIDSECQTGTILYQYFLEKESDSIKFYFRNIDGACKVKLIFSNLGFQICLLLIDQSLQEKSIKDHSDLLKLFFQEAMLSKNDILSLKEIWKTRLSESNDSFKRLRRFRLLWHTIYGNACRKISSEDETVSKFKKF